MALSPMDFADEYMVGSVFEVDLSGMLLGGAIGNSANMALTHITTDKPINKNVTGATIDVSGKTFYLRGTTGTRDTLSSTDITVAVNKVAFPNAVAITITKKSGNLTCGGANTCVNITASGKAVITFT